MAEIAREAAEQVREKGLCKHNLFNQQGQVCAQGAMLCAVGVDLMNLPTLTESMSTVGYAEYLAMRHEFDLAVGQDTPEFNDSWKTRDDDVIAVFERIAAEHEDEPDAISERVLARDMTLVAQPA